jgi:hypothetical protein
VEAGRDGIEFQAGDRQGREFALPQAGQHERLVDQRPFSPEPLQSGDHLGAEFRELLPPPFSPSDRAGVRQGADDGHGEQPDQLVFRHRPPLPPGISLLVRLGDGGERVRPHPGRVARKAPVAEGDDGIPIGVAAPGRHAVSEPRGQPLFNRPAVQVGDSRELTFAEHAPDRREHVLPVNGRDAGRFQMFLIRTDVFRERGVGPGRLVEVFPGDNLGFHPLSRPLQVGQDGQGGLPVLAPGRGVHQGPCFVSVAGRVRPGLARNPSAVRGQRGRPLLPPLVRPVGQPDALPDDDLGPRGERLVNVLW